MLPKVSVCVPTYNRKDYLKEALESIFAQTYQDYEVVVVDDGSTDGTDQMIKKAGYNARYYWAEHIGQAAARNKLIELARGEYITFLDSDDLLLPDAIQELMNVIDSYDDHDVFVYGSHIGVDENGNHIHTKQHRLPSGNIVAELFEYIHVHSCGTMCAKRIYEQEGGFDTSLRRCAVYKLLLELSLKYKFIPVDGTIYKKRRHKENLVDRSFASRKTELDVLEDFYFNGGGKEVIPRHRAMRRLSKEGYRAGRAAIREGLIEQACKFLSQSFWRYPNAKSLMHWVMAIIRYRLYNSSG
jgi:glycosyltransferase involved in cell wall biosynthesis